MPKLALYFFGAPRLERDGSLIEPDTRKAIALLAYLVVTGQPHTRDTLAALLYPENDEAHAKAALRRTLSALNKAVGEGYVCSAHELITMDANSSIWVDVIEFGHFLEQARNCRHDLRSDTWADTQRNKPYNALETCPICLPWLENAAGLYRGDFLAGFSIRDCPEFDDWHFFKSEELRRNYAWVLKTLAQSASLNGKHETAIDYARKWVALDPLLEDAHRALMKSFALAGQRNAALRQFQECSRILVKELGVAPLEETQRLNDEIQHNRLTPPKLTTSARAGEPFPSIPNTFYSLSGFKFPLVGRSPETEIMLRVYQRGAQNGHFLALQGEAGIGKTRLAEEFTAWAHQQGAVVLSARCFEGEANLAFAPFIQAFSAALDEPHAHLHLEGLAEEWLDEAGRLLPTLRSSRGEFLDQNASTSAKSIFFEGLRQVLLHLVSGRMPGVLFLDDLHWADPASLEFLAFIVRRLPRNPLLILAAWRDEDLPIQGRLRQVLAEAQRAEFATGLQLSRLQPTAVADLARQVAAQKGELSNDFIDRLFRESEGLPYFLVEYLDALLIDRRGTLQIETSPGEARADWELPNRVRDLLRLRIAQVDELAHQLLTAAAVIGRSFDFETLQFASGRSEVETLTALETLLSHRLIEECGGCEPIGSLMYDFTHDKLRSLVYEDTSLTRRRLIHYRVAEALVERARRSRDPDLIASSIAHHYHLAGNDHQAAEYHRQAGEHAKRLYANQQALDHFCAALEAGHPDRASLYEALGDLHTLIGEYAASLESYAQAVAIAVSAKDKIRLTQKIGAVYQRRGDYAQAVNYYQEALRNIDTTGVVDSISAYLSARILADWSLAAYQQGELDRALELAQQALEHATEANAPRALAQAHNLIGVLARRSGQTTSARQHLEESLALAVRLQDESAQAAALNNLSLLLKGENQPLEAIAYAQQALALCERIGDRHRAAALHNNLADLYHLSDRPEQAIEHLKQAVIIFTEIGGDATDMQPEVWKLTEW